MRFDVEKKLFVEENSEADKIAFAAADKDLTWRELKTLSDKICETLKTVNIPAGHPVLVYGDKEAFFLASLLSCYRLDLPFIPIEPTLPQKRIEKIIQQSHSRVLISCGDFMDLPKLSLVIKKDLSVFKNSIPEFSKESLIKNCAYILFTSGSSGAPKGVMISHENISSFIKWFTENFKVTTQTVFINQAPFSFDISLADFFGALQLGATAIFNTLETSNNTDLFIEKINQYKGAHFNSTPSFILKCLLNKNFNSEKLPFAASFVSIGEALPVSLVKKLKNNFPKISVINAYGPTETTIYSSFAEITEALLTEDTSSLPIAKIDDPSVFIEQDEVCIKGKQVSLGYLNEELLTREKFSVSGNEKIYFTGDLASVKNGYIYFNGRKDEQIKFNGYRIELNEIKFVLEKIDLIEQAECLPIVIDEKIKRLIAFIKMRSGTDTSSIADLLKNELPGYMVPSEIVVVKEFPLTQSAKIDKQKLLEGYLKK